MIINRYDDNINPNTDYKKWHITLQFLSLFRIWEQHVLPKFHVALALKFESCQIVFDVVWSLYWHLNFLLNWIHRQIRILYYIYLSPKKGLQKTPKKSATAFTIGCCQKNVSSIFGSKVAAQKSCNACEFPFIVKQFLQEQFCCAYLQICHSVWPLVTALPTARADQSGTAANKKGRTVLVKTVMHT